MSDFQIITDSAADIPEELMKKHKILRVPFYISFDQSKYSKEIEDISVRKFYKKLVASKDIPKTSLPSVQDYINIFMKTVKNGKDVLCITISSLFSGSYQSARAAKDILEEEMPEANIHVVDSRLATGGQGLLVLQAVYMQCSGLSVEDTAARLESLKESGRIMFTIGTLEYLQKGGRIGKAASLAGNMLNLKPLIVLREGELMPYGTVRGRNRSLSRIVSMMEDYFEKEGLSVDDYDFGICRGIEDAEAVSIQSSVEEYIGHKIEYPLFQVGVTIGTYTGPDPVGIAFIKKFDRA